MKSNQSENSERRGKRGTSPDFNLEDFNVRDTQTSGPSSTRDTFLQTNSDPQADDMISGTPLPILPIVFWFWSMWVVGWEGFWVWCVVPIISKFSESLLLELIFGVGWWSNAKTIICYFILILGCAVLTLIDLFILYIFVLWSAKLLAVADRIGIITQ